MNHGTSVKEYHTATLDKPLTTYRLVESENEHGIIVYSIFVSTDKEISYLEEFTCDKEYGICVVEALCRGEVPPYMLFDILEEFV